MIFQELNKLKHTTVMSAIILMALGVVMLICPETYINFLVTIAGYLLIILSVVIILDFIDSPKALINHIYLTIALVIGIAGIAVLIFSSNVLLTLGWLFGIILIADGVRGIIHAFLYARRSNRKGWSVLVLLSGILICVGIFIIPGVIIFDGGTFHHSTRILMRITGIATIVSAIVNAVRLIWIWPVRNGRGEEHGEER